MKNKQNKRMSLNKLTIARITPAAMNSVKGGSTAPPTVTDSNPDREDISGTLASLLCNSTQP